MVVYYIATVIASAIVIIIGTAITSTGDHKDNRIWGLAILAIGIAGVIWGGLNGHVIAQEEDTPYDGPIQTVTVGRVLSFEDNALTIAQDLVKDETATFILPAHITQAISTREAIVLDDQQVVAITAVGDEVIEVAIALRGTPPISERQVADTETRGATALWWFAILAAIIILILGLVLAEHTDPSDNIGYTGITIGIIAIIFLFFSALGCGLANGAKRGEINEEYIPSRIIGVIEGIDDRRLDIATEAGIEDTSYKLRKINDSLRLGDKISIYDSDSSAESLLLIFN